VPSDATPVLLPGSTWTARAAGDLTAGDPAQVAGDNLVARAETGTLAYVGIAGQDCPDGGQVTIVAGAAIFITTAGDDITAGQVLMAGGDGTVVADPALAIPRKRVYPDTARTRSAVALRPVILNAPELRVYPDVARTVMAVALDPDIGWPPPARARAIALDPDVIAAPELRVFPDVAAANADAPQVMAGIGVITGPGAAHAQGNALPAGLDLTSSQTVTPPAPWRSSVAAAVAVETHSGVAVPAFPAIARAKALDPAPEVTGGATVTPPAPVGSSLAGQGTAAIVPVTVISVVPNVANPFGAGQVVTVNGTGFGPDAVVEFGPAGGTRYPCNPLVTTVLSDTQIRAATPAGPAANTSATCYVTTGGQTGSRAGAYNYGATPNKPNPAPTVTSVNPNNGAAGQHVTIYGSGFWATGSIGASFGGFRASNATCTVNNQMQCDVPAGPPPGPCEVAVGVPVGTALLPNGFTYTSLAADVPPPLAARGEGRIPGDAPLIGVALTSAAQGEPVTWLARRPRYPWPAPPAPLAYVPAPPPHGPVKTSHRHPHDHGGWGEHDHPHLHRGDNRHDEGPGHPHDLRSG
jgi:hypothetical protein